MAAVVAADNREFSSLQVKAEVPAEQAKMDATDPSRQRSSVTHLSVSGAHGTRSENPLKSSYWQRRMEFWDRDLDEDPSAAVLPGAVASLPLSMQAAFRRKMFFIFSIQIAMVTGAVAALTYTQVAYNEMSEVWFKNKLFILVALSILIVVLVALYKLKEKFPLNWLLLVVFSAIQSIFFVSLGVWIDSKIGVFACIFMFACILVLAIISGKRMKNSEDGSEKLISTTMASLISYTLVLVVSFIVQIAWKRLDMTAGMIDGKYPEVTGFVSWKAFGCTAGLVLCLMMWFSYDAGSMYPIMCPDEYMNAIIYFYTDLILISVLFTLIMVLSFVAQPGSSAFYFCECCGGGGGGIGAPQDNYTVNDDAATLEGGEQP